MITINTRRMLALACSVVALSACGGAEEAQPIAAEPIAAEPIAAAETADADVTLGLAVRTLDVTGDDERLVTIELPEGAMYGDGGRFGIDVSLGPDWSNETVIKLDATCADDDDCTPTDWAKHAQEIGEPVGARRITLVEPRDESIANGWVLAGPNFNGEGATGVVARWDDGAEFYFTCMAQVALPDADRLDELVDVCLTAQPLWFE